MGKVALIEWGESPKKKIKRDTSIVEKSCLNHKYFEVNVPFKPAKTDYRNGLRLEKILLQENISYYVSDWEYTPFDILKRVDGSFFKRILSHHILHYIWKYNLYGYEELNSHVGIVGGKFSEVIDVVMPIINEVSKLTIITDYPLMYKEFVQEVYAYNKLKVTITPSGKRNINQIDVFFYLEPLKLQFIGYSPKSIWIDYTNHLKKRLLTNGGGLPIIWTDFDIVCDRQVIPRALLEAFCYEEGYSVYMLRKKINTFKLQINNAYTCEKLTMSV